MKDKDTVSTKPHGASASDILEQRIVRFIGKARKGKTGGIYRLLMNEVESVLITVALRETGGNQAETARLLGINRNTLSKKIKMLQLT